MWKSLARSIVAALIPVLQDILLPLLIAEIRRLLEEQLGPPTDPIRVRPVNPRERVLLEPDDDD